MRVNTLLKKSLALLMILTLGACSTGSFYSSSQPLDIQPVYHSYSRPALGPRIIIRPSVVYRTPHIYQQRRVARVQRTYGYRPVRKDGLSLKHSRIKGSRGSVSVRPSRTLTRTRVNHRTSSGRTRQ